MSDDKVSIEFTLPLDSDGFLRRACHTCEREFKWRPTPEGEESTPPPQGGYFCPYCGVEADEWSTEAQANYAIQIGMARVVDPMLEEFGKNLEKTGRRSGGLISIDVKVQHDKIDEPDPLSEDDDMRRVDFACHPAEPVKVLDEWNEPVCCLVCGQVAS